MSKSHLACRISFAALLLAGAIDTSSFAADPTPPPKSQVDEKLFSGMQWRQIGPFRGGRALAIEGVIDEPNTYYFGAVAGGIWKTTDGGATWLPVFDKEKGTSSIGAI